jgi:hypothetical protein
MINNLLIILHQSDKFFKIKEKRMQNMLKEILIIKVKLYLINICKQKMIVQMICQK